MRTREEMEKERIDNFKDGGSFYSGMALQQNQILEVLLDIRDLLNK